MIHLRPEYLSQKLSKRCDDRHQSTTSQALSWRTMKKNPVLENTRSTFFSHWSPRYFIVTIRMCGMYCFVLQNSRASLDSDAWGNKQYMSSSRVASNTASSKRIQITFYNWWISLITLFLRCWLWWGSRKIIDHCRYVSVRTSEMFQHIAGVSSSVCVTPWEPWEEIELGFLSPVHQR